MYAKYNYTLQLKLAKHENICHTYHNGQEKILMQANDLAEMRCMELLTI